MKELDRLNPGEREQLLMFPAYISLLAANASGGLDEVEEKEAQHLTHIKTYASEPELRPFFKEAEKNFSEHIRGLDQKLPKEKKAREQAIHKELVRLEKILHKLDKDYAELLYQSMRSYTRHVSRAHHNVLESFIIPVYIKGLTD